MTKAILLLVLLVAARAFAWIGDGCTVEVMNGLVRVLRTGEVFNASEAYWAVKGLGPLAAAGRFHMSNAVLWADDPRCLSERWRFFRQEGGPPACDIDYDVHRHFVRWDAARGLCFVDEGTW